METLKLSPSNSLPLPQQPVSLQTLPFSLLQSCKTQEEVLKVHAFSLRTGTFHHPFISSRFLALYARPQVNNLDYARSVFQLIHKPDLVSWNVLLKCYVENQRSHDAVSLFYELVHDFTPDVFTLPSVIKGCARLNAIQEGKQVHGMVLKIGCGLDKYVQSSLVSMYSKCGEISSARKVFEQIGVKDLVLCNSLIDGYARCGEVEFALQVFDEMPERDLFSWTALVDGFSKCGRIELARDIFDRMPSRNMVSWNALINGYMKSGGFVIARQLFDEMPTRDIITWNSMIAGYEFNGRFMDALYLFLTLLKEGPVPNHTTLVAVLAAVSGLAILGKGKWIHSLMVKSGVEPEGVLGTSLINMYSKCGSVESALTVFRSISRKKLGHWDAIIVGLGMHGMANHAIGLFSEMRRCGLKPHAITFLGVLNACSHAGLVDLGRQYFNMMVRKNGIVPAVEHYASLIDILCRAGNLEEAKDITESMPMQPNKNIWMSLLSGSRNFGNVKIGEYAAQRLIEVAPDTIGCYVMLSDMYAAAGKWDKVSWVREMMRKRRIQNDLGSSCIEQRHAS
ncbi:Tetratricopeptide-like helical domain containing protein [Parasponia andersonii]|uniref:Tetratricopeptide-like helical domain containing protein n=1 Tax=Parasponia andersonii TaxID=3476 RepID=A0A2P5E5A2_PARAD|nr:Tetratricopeptide-like helical domain containing protein [Parasponia andersonii]